MAKERKPRAVSEAELVRLQAERRKDRSQSVTRRRRSLESSPKHIGSLLTALFRSEPDLTRQMEEARALGAWQDVVGETAARFSQASRLRDGKLTVVVADPLWMQQLHFLKREILKRYREKFPRLEVRELYFALQVCLR